MTKIRYLSPLVFAIALGLSGPAAGQTPGSGQAPAQAATLGPSSFLDAAQDIVNAIDRYEMATVWDVSSPIMKSSIPKDRFVANVAQRRAILGSIRTRDWTSIMRVPITTAGGPLPVGQYISIRFATTGQNGKAAEEVVSFSLDQDGQWRMAGYTIQ